MIRDEFKQNQQENLSSREIKQIRKLGERAFYISSVNKLKDYLRLINFSTILGIILCVFPFVNLFEIVFLTSQDSHKSLIAFIFVSLFYLWAILWYALVRPLIKRKYKKYQQKLKEISNKEISRYQKK